MLIFNHEKFGSKGHFLSLGFVVLSWISASSLSAESRDSDAFRLNIVGEQYLSAEVLTSFLRSNIGAGTDEKEFCVEAKRLLSDHYRAEGYTFVQIWCESRGNSTFALTIDEGRMDQIIFVGAGAFQEMMFNVEFFLPGKIFHMTRLSDALKRLKEKHDLKDVHSNVRELPEKSIVYHGYVRGSRVLMIHVIGREFFGLGISVQMKSISGLTPTLRLRESDVFFDNDRLETELEIGLPYRKFLVDEAPELQWVHAAASIDYEFAPVGKIAPALTMSVGGTTYNRSDLELEKYIDVSMSALGGVSFRLLPAMSLRLYLGLDYTTIQEADTEALARMGSTDTERMRGLTRLQWRFEQHSDRLRIDLRNHFDLSTTLALSEWGQFSTDLMAESQYVLTFSNQALLFRGRLVALFGYQEFWDQQELAGNFLRVFFDNRYYIQKAAQVDIGYRVHAFSEKVQVGVFLDGSVFDDRTIEPIVFGWAVAAGPSLHLILFDALALDAYFGFGYDGNSFANNLSLSIGNAF